MVMQRDIKKKEYQKLMLEIRKEDLPSDWAKRAVVKLFGKLDSVEKYNKYYSLVCNVRLGRSYKKGKSLGIINYIIDEVKNHTGRDLMEKQ